MANIRLQVGSVTSQINATDQGIRRILQAMLRQRGYDVAGMTQQAQADAVLDILRHFIVESATAHEAQAAAEAARLAVLNSPPPCIRVNYD